MMDYDYASDPNDYIYLQYNWLSTDPAMQVVCHRLGERWKDDKTPIRRSKRDMQNAFNVVLTSIEVSGGYANNLRIVTDKEVYGGAQFLRSPAHTREVLDALLWLIESGYLEQVTNKTIIKRHGEQTFLPFNYVLTEKWFKDISDRPISDPKHIIRNHQLGCVLVRKRVQDKKGKDFKVSVPLKTFTDQQDIDLFNASTTLIQQHDELMRTVSIVDGEGNDVLPHRTSMTRIFSNGNTADGGRFYCPIQQLENKHSQQRLKLKMDGLAVVEVDYSSLHPTLLYNIKGTSPPADAYEIDGFDRKHVKTAFNIMLNCSAEMPTSAVVTSIAKHTETTKKDAKALYAAILKQHAAIVDMFNKGYGLKLQRMDSDMATKVINYFVNVLKKPIIMIHDSAIVQYTELSSLVMALQDAFNDVLAAPTEHLTTLVENVDEGTMDIEQWIATGCRLKVETADDVTDDVSAYVEQQLLSL